MTDTPEVKEVKEGVIVNEDNTAPKPVKGDDAEKEMNGAVVAKEYYSSSMITDPRRERRQVALVTFASGTAAGSYILMLFIAMPLSIHTIVNGNDGCNVEVDSACFAPTESSQKQLTLALTLLRISTFLMGSLVGTLSDRYGRKPLLVGALLGYTCAGGLFLIGWASKKVGFFLLGSIVLGSSSPVTPHGVAYVSDISVPSRLAINMGYLEGFGYFFGLMGGAILSLIIASLTTGKEETIKTYDQMFYSSYALGLVLSLLSAIIIMFFLPESLHPNDRSKKIDVKKANPFGFLPLVTRNMYFFLIWMSGMFAWGSIGAQESAAGGWWLRRYAISDTTQFIQFTVLLWVFSGLGAAICTKLYVSCGGLKFAVHISAIMTIVTGITFSLAPTSNLSYITVAFSFFASAVLPTTLAVLMGQVSSKEKGALAGALRSSEALGKFIGIVIVGNTFATYISSFTPDDSCIPADHGVNSSNNDCDCGIETCPVFTGELTNLGFPTFKKVPSPCTLGQLTQKLIGKPSKFVQDGVDANLRIVPQLFVDSGDVNRPEECLSAGLLPGRDGLTTNVDRAWCISAAAANSTTVHKEFGCQGFDISKFLTDEIFIACTNTTGLEVELECGPLQQAIFSTFPSTYQISIPEGKLDNFTSIRDNILDLDYDGLICEGSSKARYNVCIDGPISSFPGFFPFMFMGLLAVLAYLAFVIGEIFFVYGDQEYWKDHERELTQVEEITDNKLGV